MKFLITNLILLISFGCNGNQLKQYEGQIKFPMMAIGGETTGMILKTEDNSFELILKKEHIKEIQKNNHKQVIIRGIPTTLKGIERGDRQAIEVREIKFTNRN